MWYKLIMKDKYIYILLCIGIVLTIVVFGWLLLLSFSGTTSDAPSQSTPIIQSTPTPIVIPFTKPSVSTLTVNGISVQNFYKQGTIIDTNGDVSIRKTKLYDIVYLAPFQEFIIEVLAKPFQATRLQAERAFLQQLAITQEEACKLRVSLGTPYDVNPVEAGTKFGLSFCETP